MPISAVLPLKVSGSYDVNDLKRAHILFSSLSKFLSPGLISELFVVTPASEVEIVKNEYARWAHLNIAVISEEDLLPELKNYPKMRGWRKQQLVKIAIADKISNEFYLTLDADVVCLKPITESDLIIDGKAILQYEQRSRHPKWWKASSRLLKINSNIGPQGVGMTVTPALMSKTLSRTLMADLSPKRANKTWADNLCSLHNPSDPKNWWLGRYLKLKWTEYSLYYLCALKHQILDDFHVICGTEKIPQKLLVDDSHDYQNWHVADSFAEHNPGLFLLVGSKSRLPPKQVFERLSPFINNSNQPVTSALFD
ncbi:DUF6492 family protein [Catenovulum sediminis]|uniref:DUF6492 family protein n=1 Tax=Catenovulum sediminis TaxID=1740262 RepID=A0ABV1RIQ4_9ALTE